MTSAPSNEVHCGVTVGQIPKGVSTSEFPIHHACIYRRHILDGSNNQNSLLQLSHCNPNRKPKKYLPGVIVSQTNHYVQSSRAPVMEKRMQCAAWSGDPHQQCITLRFREKRLLLLRLQKNKHTNNSPCDVEKRIFRRNEKLRRDRIRCKWDLALLRRVGN